MRSADTRARYGIEQISRWRVWLAVCSAVLAVEFFAATADASQFSYLDPGYVQEIYTGPLVGGPGMAWTSSNNLLTRNGSDIIEYSLTQNAVHQGTNIHGSTVTHTVSSLSFSGAGMTNGKDGYIYVATNYGLQRFNPSNWAAPAQSLPGTVGGQGYGITTLPDGRIVYSDAANASNVYLYNPSSGNNSLIYSASFLIDDIEASPTGQIALAGQSNNSIAIISSLGALINSFAVPHYPDGLAFGDGAASNALFSNNNDGTITKYTFPSGYASVPAILDIATGSGAYGDLAAVGPDCSFYVTQFDNGGYHGSTAGIGTHWDNGTTNAEPSIIRISAVAGNADGTVSEVCGFYAPTEHVPEPGTLLLMLTGVAALLVRTAWTRKRGNV